MNDKRFSIGITLTVAWLFVMAMVLFLYQNSLSDLKPNEWGDFFAGFFAPLAFLWLVLGYLQQGQELKLSTEALRLQADELRHSVQQQKELVEVTRQQVEGEREALALERAQRKHAAQPHFIASPGGGSFSGNQYNYGIKISNAGNQASSVVITASDETIGSLINRRVDIIPRSSDISLQIHLTQRFPEGGANIYISYNDADGNPGNCVLRAYLADSSDRSTLLIDKATDEAQSQR
jgi:hypothetical protein